MDFLESFGLMIVLIVAAVLFALGILGWQCKREIDDIDGIGE